MKIIDKYMGKGSGIMTLELVSDYRDDDTLRLSFDKLSQKIFGISFEEWYQRGLWKDNYICYSYRHQDKIAANVSVTRLILKRGGREKEIMQLGTVMTDPDYRGRGLAGSLIDQVVNLYEDRYRAFFLFANYNVLNFYPRFGFQRMGRLELYTRDSFDGSPVLKFQKLDMEDTGDIEILTGIAEERQPTSDRFFIAGGQEILYWYCLGLFKNNIYYNRDEDIIVIYGRVGETLNIYDVITRKGTTEGVIPYKEILTSIYREGIRETVFHFNLEPGDINLESRPFDDLGEDDPMFVRGELDMAGVCFPITAHT